MQYASPEPIRHGTEKKNIAFYFHDSREAGSNTGTISAHWHSEYEFVYVYAGQASFFLNGTQREVHAGEAVIINKNVIHSSTPSGGEPVRFMCVVFGEQFAFSSMSDALYEEYYLPLYLNNREFPTLVQGTTEWGTRFLTILKSLCESGRKQLPGCDLEWRILLLSLFHLACTEHIFVEGKPSQTRHIVPIRQILTYIEANYTEHLSIPALARQAGFSTEYFCRIFKEIVQKTPVEYIMAKRVEHAMYLLAHTQDSVTAVASASGFGDLNYFSRCFKRISGMTAREYRRRFS